MAAPPLDLLCARSWDVRGAEHVLLLRFYSPWCGVPKGKAPVDRRGLPEGPFCSLQRLLGPYLEARGQGVPQAFPSQPTIQMWTLPVMVHVAGSAVHGDGKDSRLPGEKFGLGCWEYESIWILARHQATNAHPCAMKHSPKIQGNTAELLYEEQV